MNTSSTPLDLAAGALDAAASAFAEADRLDALFWVGRTEATIAELRERIERLEQRGDGT